MKALLPALFLMISMPVLAQNALNFDGSNDYVQTSQPGVLGKTNRTFEAWIKLDSSATGNNCIMDYGLNKVGSRNSLSASSDGKLVYISGGTNANMGTSANSLPIGVWTHIAFVLKSGTGYMYINGKQEATANLSTVNTPSGNTDLRIGQRVSGGNIPFKGDIDEVRVWNVARTASEINANMSTELCATQKNLVAYHKFNQGIAYKNNSKEDESTDVSGKGKHGDLENFSLNGTTSNWVIGKNLTLSPITKNDTLTKCGKYKGPTGKTYTSSGTYIDTIESFMGCDSIITTLLTIIPNPTKTIYDTSCTIYLSPSGQYAWNKSGTYTDQLSNPKGCDTIVTVHLIVSNKSRTNDVVTHCGPYTSPSGKYTWTATGTYSDTLSSQYECDSIVTTTFTQLQTSSTIQVSECNSYNSPSGKYTYTSSGVYSDTLPNSNNCDSIITIELTLGNTTYSSISEFACKKYTSPSGKYEFTSSGLFYDTIPNYSGCDSVISIQLEIGARSSSINAFACDIYNAPSGAVFTESGQYTDVIKTKKGCDSTITINLVVMKTAYSSTTLSGCNKVTSPSGRHIYTVSGTYSDTIFRQTKCDSVISVEVTIDELSDVSVVRVDNETLEASESGDSYRWLSCEGYVAITGETSKTFTPDSEDLYAVEVTKGQCIDTSVCYSFVGQNEIFSNNLIKVYPNPTNGQLTIYLNENLNAVEIEIIDLSGKTVVTPILNNGGTNLDISDLRSGLYYVKVIGQNGIFTVPLGKI